MIREMVGHENRVGTMAWSSTLLASGSRDRNILLQDIRVRGYTSSGSSAASSNSSMNTTSNTTVARGYSGVQYTYGSPGRASTGGVGSAPRGAGGNVTAAMLPQGVWFAFYQ